MTLWGHTSEKTQRGFCTTCGTAMSAIDDGYDKMGLTMATLDNPSEIPLDLLSGFV